MRAAADEESSTLCAGILSSRAQLACAAPTCTNKSAGYLFTSSIRCLLSLLPFKSSSIVAMAPRLILMF